MLRTADYWPTRRAIVADDAPARRRMASSTLSPSRTWTLDTMTTRSAALITIGLLAMLLAFVALAALFAGDISERAGGIVSSVLGTFATVLAGLLLFLRVETINTKADEAATHAAMAAEKAAAVESKVDTVHHDMLNGGMRENVKKAISEDRHALRNRKAAERARAQLEARGMPKQPPT